MPSLDLPDPLAVDDEREDLGVRGVLAAPGELGRPVFVDELAVELDGRALRRARLGRVGPRTRALLLHARFEAVEVDVLARAPPRSRA